MKTSELLKSLKDAGCILARHGGGHDKWVNINVRDMDNVLVTVSQALDGSYWCHTEQDVYGSGLNGAGASVKEAKADLMACMEEARADYVESGGVAYDVDFSYQYDLQSFFEYFSFLNVTDIARRAGINPSLMRQYTRGIKKAGEKTYARLSACMDSVTKELQAASFRV